MLVSLSNLAANSEMQKNIYTKVRLVTLIDVCVCLSSVDTT